MSVYADDVKASFLISHADAQIEWIMYVVRATSSRASEGCSRQRVPHDGKLRATVS